LNGGLHAQENPRNAFAGWVNWLQKEYKDNVEVWGCFSLTLFAGCLSFGV
jgi:hypothetical protein